MYCESKQGECGFVEMITTLTEESVGLRWAEDDVVEDDVLGSIENRVYSALDAREKVSCAEGLCVPQAYLAIAAIEAEARLETMIAELQQGDN